MRLFCMYEYVQVLVMYKYVILPLISITFESGTVNTGNPVVVFSMVTRLLCLTQFTQKSG
jgi:hypothetical protein